jgi:hypothetical protein
MTARTYFRLATILTAAGVLFSGYLSTVRMHSGICAFDEPCPSFLGHPACYTGFTLFATLFIVSSIALIRRSESAWPMVVNLIVSAFGGVFAGHIAVAELGARAHYAMGLPSCAWGFVFFLAVLISSLAAWLKHTRAPSGPPLRHREA